MSTENKIIKTFSFDSKDYILTSPTANILREAKFIYSKRFTQSIKDGLYTRKKLEVLLKEGEIDIIGEHFNKRNEILVKYNEFRKLAELALTIEDIEYYAEVMKICRESLIQEDMSLQDLFSNTADQLAEEDRISYLTSMLIRYKEDSSRVWGSLEELMNDTNFSLVEACKAEIIFWQFNLTPNLEESFEETKLLRKAKEMKQVIEAKALEAQDSIALAAAQKEVKTSRKKLAEGVTPKGRPPKKKDKKRTLKEA
jgi:hypothetical protein